MYCCCLVTRASMRRKKGKTGGRKRRNRERERKVRAVFTMIKQLPHFQAERERGHRSRTRKLPAGAGLGWHGQMLAHLGQSCELARAAGTGQHSMVSWGGRHDPAGRSCAARGKQEADCNQGAQLASMCVGEVLAETTVVAIMRPACHR